MFRGHTEYFSAGQSARLHAVPDAGLVAGEASVEVEVAGQPSTPEARWCTRVAGGFAAVLVEADRRHRVRVAAIQSAVENLGRAETPQKQLLAATSIGGVATVQAFASQEATRCSGRRREPALAGGDLAALWAGNLRASHPAWGRCGRFRSGSTIAQHSVIT